MTVTQPGAGTTAATLGLRTTAGWERAARVGVAADAAASAAVGLLLLVGSSGLDSAFGIRFAAVLALGAVLVLWAVPLTFVLRRSTFPLPALRTIIGLNMAWVLASAAAVAIGWDGRTTLGTAFVIAQAVAVVGLAELQFKALRAAGRSGA